MMDVIEVPVDPSVAQRYRAFTEEQRRELAEWLVLWLDPGDEADERPLSEIARELGEEARRNGLTPELFDEIVGE